MLTTLFSFLSIIPVTRFGVAFDISGYTIQTATERLSLENHSLCNIAPTRFILYKTQTLFQDGNLSANTSVATEIISAQAGDSQLSDLQRPVVMSFDILTESSVVRYSGLTCKTKRNDACGNYLTCSLKREHV